MPIEVTCPGCRQVHTVPDEWAGKTVRCQGCQTRHNVPSPQGMPTPPPVLEDSPAGPAAMPPAPAPVPPAADRGWSGEQSHAAPPPASVSTTEPEDYPVRQPEMPPSTVAPPSPAPARAPAGPSDEVALPADGPSADVAQPQAFQGIMNQVLAGMGQALSPRKLAFFAISSFAGFLVCCLMILVGVGLGAAVHVAAAFLMVLLAMLAAIGLSGVIAGGVAFMAVEEGQGRSCRLPDVFQFCGKRFLPLFLGVILLGFGVLCVLGVANGLIAAINLNRTIGSLLGSLLFLPQTVLNGALLVLCLVSVLVPCAVVIEGVGPVEAIRRLVTLLVRYPGGLLLQFGITLFAGSMMLYLLVFLAIASLGPTMATNGPSLPSLPSFSSSAEERFDAFPHDDFGGRGFPGMDRGQFPGSGESRTAGNRASEAKGPWGGFLRHIGLGVVFIAIVAFPSVFWICSFARYYESILPSLPSAVPQSPASKFPPPVPAA